MKWMVVQLISLALEAEVARPAINLFPVPPSTTWLWTQVLVLLIPAILVIGGIWYLWRLLRALERIADIATAVPETAPPKDTADCP